MTKCDVKTGGEGFIVSSVGGAGPLAQLAATSVNTVER